MALPNPGMDAVPFTPLTAEFLDDMIENIESLSDGTGFENGAVTTAKIADSAVTAAKTTGIWWEELGRATLSSASSSFPTITIDAKKHLKIIFSTAYIGAGSIDLSMRFNSDSGSNYAYRYSINGAADTTSKTSKAYAQVMVQTSGYYSGEITLTNISNMVKAYTGYIVAGTTSAASLSNRNEVVGQWTNTSSQITTVDIFGPELSGGATYAIGSEVIVLGHD